MTEGPDKLGCCIPALMQAHPLSEQNRWLRGDSGAGGNSRAVGLLSHQSPQPPSSEELKISLDWSLLGRPALPRGRRVLWGGPVRSLCAAREERRWAKPFLSPQVLPPPR